MSNDPNQSTRQTLVDKGTTLKGGIVSSCPVLVNGNIEGDLEVPELTVSSTGTVRGTVTANSVRSEGTIGGQLKAKRIELSGVVLPNTIIEADELDIQLGGEGKSLQLTFGESPVLVAGSTVEGIAVGGSGKPAASNGSSSAPKSRRGSPESAQP